MRLALWLVVLSVIAAGCLGGGSSHSGSSKVRLTPTGSLAIAVRMVVVRQIVSPCPLSTGDPCGGVPSRHPPARRYSTRHYRLTCNPAGGTLPNPQAACAAMTDLSKPRPPARCTGDAMVAAPTAMANLVGTFDHHPFKLRITDESWCGQPRPVMRDLWVLSTFPCSSSAAPDSGCKPT